MQRAMRQPLLWLSVLIGAVLAVVVGGAYLGGFTDPVGNLHNVRVGIVDLDESQSFGGQDLAVGKTFTTALFDKAAAADNSPIELVRYRSEADARADLERNRITAAAILPKTLTSDVIDVGLNSASGTTAEPVTVRLLINEGAGALQPSVVTKAAELAQQELANTISAQLVKQLDDAGLKLDPANAAVIGQPVRVETSGVPALTDRAGRGLPPLYYSVVVTLVGLLSAVGVHSVIGAMLDEEPQFILGRKLRLPRLELDRWERFRLEAVLLVPTALLGGASATITAKWIIDTQMASVPATLLISVLGALALAWITLAVVTGFDELGLLVAVLATTIFGVPSARGVYPPEAMPAFFRALGFLPMRWIVDGARAAFYFDGRGDAGLTKAVIVLVLYIGGALLLGVLIARVSARRAAVDAEVEATDNVT